MFRCVLVTALALPVLGCAEEKKEDIRDLKLKDWDPKSMMVTKVTNVEKPRYPVIDIHNHLGGGKDRLTAQVVNNYLKVMNDTGVRTIVNLDGGWGERLKESVAALDEAHPGRFLTFALVNFDNMDDPDWGKREAKRLEESFRAGARGLKFHKTLGLRYRYKNGKLMTVDDPKLDPVWETCARFKRPVVIHVADPAAFFTPLDRHNERWHELNANPGWLFYGGNNPKRQDVLDQLHHVIAKHPKTTFINTHFGNNAEDLASVAEKLDRYPNMFVDIDARISELGRQPHTTRRFFIKYQDRILFGTDTNPRRDAYRIYYRFLETDDEYFDCSASHHRQGFWNIHGIHLPDVVLEKVYRRNAERILQGLKAEPSQGALQETKVAKTDDFSVSGDGTNLAWKKADWISLTRRGKGGLSYQAQFKLLHSRKGLYLLANCSDAKITATMKDFDDLWKEDVFEAFFWTDEQESVYLEYEISPKGAELPLLISNQQGKLYRWRPFHYDADRKINKAVRIIKDGDQVKGWTAEVFIPYELFSPLQNVPPQSGSRWRANFYRMDYDDGMTTSWDWARVGSSFHEIKKFGTLVFE